MNTSSITIAWACLASGQLERAYDIAIGILQREPQNVEALCVLSDVYQRVGRPERAIEAAQAAFRLQPDDELVRTQLAWLFARSNQLAEAKSLTSFSLNQKGTPDSWRKLAQVWARLEEFSQVLTVTEQGLRFWPDDEVLLHERANALRFTGQKTEAADIYWSLIERNVTLPSVYYALADMGAGDDEKLVQLLKMRLANGGGDTLSKIYWHHALYKTLERQSKFDEAFKHLQHGNRLQKSRLGFQMAVEKKRFAASQSILKVSRKNTVKGGEGVKPIFVLGMPRTGTTLVDRIISSHSQVKSVGESQQLALSIKRVAATATPEIIDTDTLTLAYQHLEQVYRHYLDSIQPLAQGANKVVDSMPMNFYFLPLLMAFPDVKVICLVRSGMDACFGNYRQLFAPNLPYYGYSYDQEDVAEFYGLFRHFVRSVENQGAQNIRVLSYERLVASPEDEIRALIEFCELPWEPGCLSFHRNPSAVATASAEQVREPVNKRYIGRWKRYSVQLSPMLERLRATGLCEDEIVGPAA